MITDVSASSESDAGNSVHTFNRNQLAILGAVCGDIIGSIYELPGNNTKDINFDMFLPDSHVTDDSVLTMAILEALVKGTDFAEALRKWGNKYPAAGYGRRFRTWLSGDTSVSTIGFTNGCAMRVSPIGAVATCEEEVLRLAEASAVVTHNHPEGVKGAQACALGVYLALHGAGKEMIKKKISDLTGYDLDRHYIDLQPEHKFDFTCPGSVPEAIICFLESSDYESAVRKAIAMGGDADTMAAIAGSIAAAYYGLIPEPILNYCLERIPDDMMVLIREVKNTMGYAGQ